MVSEETLGVQKKGNKQSSKPMINFHQCSSKSINERRRENGKKRFGGETRLRIWEKRDLMGQNGANLGQNGANLGQMRENWDMLGKLGCFGR